MTGKITRVFLPRGFAFLIGEDGQDYFLHATELRDTPWSGETVRPGVKLSFTPRGNGADDLRATEATVVPA